MSYNNRMCECAAVALTQRWGTVLPVPLTMTASIVNVMLPCSKQGGYVHMSVFYQCICACVCVEKGGLIRECVYDLPHNYLNLI